MERRRKLAVPTKVETRRATWERLRTAHVARFPGARGRIPNFTGAEEAARRLRESSTWRRAHAILASPNLPQRAVRHAALCDGKIVVLGTFRLEGRRPFLVLDPRRIAGEDLWEASAIRTAAGHARTPPTSRLPRIDLCVPGCVAVAGNGARLGRGDGAFDLEYALLRAVGRVGARTRIVTTVHPLQVLELEELPFEAHDVPLDEIYLPAEVVACRGRRARPPALVVSDDVRAASPALRRAFDERGKPRTQSNQTRASPRSSSTR